MEINVIESLLFIMVSLLIGVILKMVLRRTFIPYTVGLFVVGLIIGSCSHYGLIELSPLIDHTLDGVSNMQPDIILYIFLPILIFEASLNLDTHIFKNTFTNASILAVPGVAVALLLTGCMLMGIQYCFPNFNPEWSWSIAFLFGALISATDPVAVVALLHELKTDKRFSTLVDAESMLNDGTGIVFFMLFFSAYTTVGLHYGPVVNFLLTVFGAIAIALVVSGISLFLTRRAKNDAIIQNSILFIAAYILFYLTNSVLEVSGIIALVTFGVVIAYSGRTRLSRKASAFIRDFWALAAYLANTLIFIIVGIMIAMKCNFTWTDLGIVFIVYIGLNLIRGTMIFLFLPIMRRFNYGLTIKEAIVLSWGGLRGALGLVLALLVFYTPTIPESIRQQVLFLTGGIVTLTLTINATTTGWLLKKMKLTRKPSSKLLLDYNIQSIYHEKMSHYLESLKEKPSLKEADWSKLTLYLPRKGEKPTGEEITKHSFLTYARTKVIQKELSLSMQLFQNGTISVFSQKKLSGMAEELDDKNGTLPFTKLQERILHIGALSQLERKIINLNSFFTRLFHSKITNYCDLLYGFITIQESSLLLISELMNSTKLEENEKEAISIIKEELEANQTVAQDKLDYIASNYPTAYQLAVQDKAKRMLLKKERQIIQELEHLGMLSEEEQEEMQNQVGRKNRN
ncbi:MAG: cation:proton antiporter [Phocaeicola sp.]